MADIVELRNLRKSYGTIRVLKDISLSFRRGEIHAFLGANGAGKSTLLGCLSGAVAPSFGQILVNGHSYASLTPRQARDLGIGIIYQQFQVIDGLSVADNIFLGCEKSRFGVVDKRGQERAAAGYLAQLGLEIDPSTLLERLSIGERQLVEIARALHQRPSLLVLDEPTAALSKNEIGTLHGVVRRLARQENIAIIYVTHLMEEIHQIADQVSILRDGQIVWTLPENDTTPQMIASAIAPMMVRSDSGPSTFKQNDEALMLNSYQSGFSGPIDLSLHRGEIIGLYGLLGSGRTDLLESIIGARPRIAGEMRVQEEKADVKNPRDAFSRGIALVAADRPQQSLFSELSAQDNLLMPHFNGIARGAQQQRALFEQFSRRVKLSPGDPNLLGGRFSGGNAQKMMIGRWLLPEAGVDILLLDEPTQGVDIGARAELYTLLRDFVAAGGAIIVASSDPEELVTLADRVLIMAHGRQAAIIDENITEDRLVHLAHQAAASFANVA